MSGLTSVGCRWLVVAAILAASPAAAQQTDAYFARKIWTGRGPAIESGVLVVRDGSVVAVGPRSRVVVPASAVRHNVDVIIPGLIAAQTELSTSAETERTLTPEHRALDGFDFYAPRDSLLAGGVTTVQISTAGNRLISGQGAVVKLAGSNLADRTLRPVESLRIILTQASRSPSTIYEPPVGPVSVDRPLEPTSRQLGTSLASAASGLRAVLKAAEDAGNVSPDSADSLDAGVLFATVSQYLEPGRRWRISAETPAEIRVAIELAEQFRISLLLVDPGRLEVFANQLEHWSPRVAGVVLRASTRPGRIQNTPVPKPRELAAALPWVEARRLRDAGIPVAIRAANDADLGELLYLGGLFLRGGFQPHEVLEMLTLAPAKMLEVDRQVGSLAANKDADFVVLSDDPFALRTRVEATFVAGAKVYDRRRAERTTVIKAAQVYRGPREIVEDGAVVVRGSTIRGVGTDVSAPLDADVRRFDGAVVVPGFIDLRTGLGIGGALSGSISLQTRLGDQLDPADPSVPVARQGGVTTVLLMNSGTAPSPVVAFKLGDQPRVLKDPVALKFAMTGNLTSQTASLQSTLRQGRAYHQSWVTYAAQQAEYEKALKEYEASQASTRSSATERASAAGQSSGDAESGGRGQASGQPGGRGGRGRFPGGGRIPGGRGEGNPAPGSRGDATHDSQEETKDEDAKDDEKKDEATEPKSTDDEEKDEAPKPPTEPRKNEALEPYRALFEGKIPALVEARRKNQVAAAIKLFREEFKLRLILLGADDLARDPSLVAGHDVAVSVGPTVVNTVDRQPVNLPQVLANEQITYGFQSEATTGVRDLPQVVQYAVRKGLGVSDALEGLTAGAAGMMAIDDSVGTLAAGKAADLVVLSGPPFELATEVLAVMIDGQWVYEKTKQ